MERHDVTLLKQLLLRVDSMNASLLYGSLGAEGIVGIDLHAEAFGYACHVAAHVAEGEDAEALALELCACLAVIEVAHGEDEQAKHQLCHGVRVLAGSVLHNHALLLGIGRVDAVVASTCTHHDLKLLGSIKHLGCDLV